jgi:hypothetical protein
MHAVDVMRQKGPLMGLAQKLVAITYPAPIAAR